jgi:glycerol uptake facilitator-like aquaporin
MVSKRVNRLSEQFHIKNALYRALLAEFMGTMLLTYVGFSMNAQTILSRSERNGNLGNTIGWGLILLFAITMSWNISGLLLSPIDLLN